MFVHINGELHRAHDARVSPYDRGLLLGDAVYETMRAYSGRAFDLDRHLARLRRSADLTGIPFPQADLPDAIREVVHANGLAADDAAVRVTLTAGVGGAGTSRRGVGPPTLIVTAQPVPYDESIYASGVTSVLSRRVRRQSPDVLDPRIKSVNYLPHVLARREAEERGAYDAILLDRDGRVSEATSANVFAVLDGEIATPPLDSGCLDGITRERVLALATRAGYAAGERHLTPDDLAAADEIFLTASVAEVLPVARHEDAPVGAVQPGPVARALRRAYKALAKA